MRRRVIIAALAIGVGCAAPAAARDVSAATAVPRPTCQPGDLPETALQGQVPLTDRESGRAAQGYACNLRQIGGAGAVNTDPTHARTAAWANFDSYGNCAYYGNGDDGTVVVDVSDPARPVQTTVLKGGAMGGPWESLRVNARRGLLVGLYAAPADKSAEASASPSPMDVYDVSGDCAHPRRLFSGVLPNAAGHEGWFQPDGLVYYASDYQGQVVPIDLSDPRNPRELAVWNIRAHGGSVSDDGTRGYFCVADLDQRSHFVVVDTSEVQARRPDASFREIATLPMPDTNACQETYPVTYDGRPYAIQFGELGESVTSMCPTQSSTFSRPHIIDLADERHPKIVTTIMNEVALPENCEKVSGDRSVPRGINALQGYSLFVYGTHMCDPDRLHDPTILVCGEWLSGIRVYDIRDPLRPKELAYFTSGTLSPSDPTVDTAGARPVVRPDRGEIWYASGFYGFHVLKFANGVYPFDEALVCPRQPDRFVEQYDATTSAQCATGASAPTPLGLPSPRQCASRRTFTIRPRARRLRSARVYVNGTLVRVLRGRRSRARIDLRGLPRGVVRVKVVAITRGGRRIIETRRYRTCVARETRSARSSTAGSPRRTTLSLLARGPAGAGASPLVCRLLAREGDA
jgi:hypothetical protein